MLASHTWCNFWKQIGLSLEITTDIISCMLSCIVQWATDNVYSDFLTWSNSPPKVILFLSLCKRILAIVLTCLLFVSVPRMGTQIAIAFSQNGRACFSHSEFHFPPSFLHSFCSFIWYYSKNTFTTKQLLGICPRHKRNHQLPYSVLQKTSG